MPSAPAVTLEGPGAKAFVIAFDQDVDRCVDQYHCLDVALLFLLTHYHYHG